MASLVRSIVSPVTVQIVSDIVLPYCYIGAKYLEKASKLTDIPVIIQWKPFYLNETTPAEGMALSDYIDMKYGAGAYKSFQPRFNSMKKMGEQVGIMFTDDRKIYATTKAHVLMEIINANVGLNEQGICYLIIDLICLVTYSLNRPLHW